MHFFLHMQPKIVSNDNMVHGCQKVIRIVGIDIRVCK